MVDVFDPLKEAEGLLEKWGKWSAPRPASEDGQRFPWGDPRNEPGSIVDAERLLCLLLAVTQLDRFRLERPYTLPETRVQMLQGDLRKGTDFAQRVIDELTEYHQTYERDGRPLFGAGSYLEDAEGMQVDPDVEVVDSFTLSVSLSLYTLLLVKAWSKLEDSELEGLKDLREMAHRRLTAALRGLVDSFCVAAAPDEYAPGEHWQEKLGDVLIGLESLDREAGVPERSFFECGWSWGRLHPSDRAITVNNERDAEHVDQGQVWAERAPYLYFSVNAIDGIVDLFSADVRSAGILDDEQLDLAGLLQRCWEMTQRYWSVLAFSEQRDARWRLEDLPWETTDGELSDYWSMLVVGIATQTTDRSGRTSPADVARLTQVLVELAQRARITRRTVPVRIAGVKHPDPALGLHHPGVRMALAVRTDSGHADARYTWTAYDFAPQLLKRTARVLAAARTPEERRELRSLMDAVWDHLHERRVRRGGKRRVPWDDVGQVFEELEDGMSSRVGSWYFTERVMEALVACVQATRVRATATGSTVDLATDLLAEADFLLAQTGIETDLDLADSERLDVLRKRVETARDKGEESPGLAIALSVQVLQALLERQPRDGKS